MWKILKTELSLFLDELEKLDRKTVTIFISSSILFAISWYFSNPKFFNDVFTFHKSFDLILEDLVSFSYWFLFDFILFLIIPLLLIKFIFNEQIKDYGISFGDVKVGFAISVFSIIMFIPIIYFISSSENFMRYFPLMKSAKDEIVFFIVYEILFVLFIFAWEFIFRGYILFGLEKRFGIYAIFIQMMPFVILHNGKPFIETSASIFGGILLGYLALRTRSILYGFIIHAAILVVLDILA